MELMRLLEHMELMEHLELINLLVSCYQFWSKYFNYLNPKMHMHCMKISISAKL